ncbi:hypothetical protein CVT24_004871 [Panaeolus cyanescens]|uniref:Uncharacterized protein n=1 Tax=Panaeolus cyanescens TaxID=181874 RepID=A0A409V9W2_9AGAR|nr:hypothetical protein CVT24_004871 [Panaeolus cyanescens]
MCNPIFDFLVHVWIIFTSYFSRSSSTPTVLPVSTVSSTVYSTRSKTRTSSGTNVNSEPETWKAQKEQFLRHPSLRRSSSSRSTRAADGSPRSAAGNSEHHWQQYIGQEKDGIARFESLVPQVVSPNLPAVIVTPCTPSVDDSKNSEGNLQFASPVGSPLDMTIASYKAILPFPTILKPNRTPSRRRRDKEKSMGKRIRFDTVDAHDILEGLENPFRISAGSLESHSFSSPEGDHISCFPDSTVLPPESPSPPAAESTVQNHHLKDENKMAYPWDFPSWTTNTDRINIADPNLPSYMTSTPPRKRKITNAPDNQALEQIDRASLIKEKDLSEAVLELLPYPDVFDLDMYFCEISMRRSLPPPPGLGVSGTASHTTSSTQDSPSRPTHELDVGTTPLDSAFEHTPNKPDSPAPTTPPSPFSRGQNRMWSLNDNKLTMSNNAVEADVVSYKDVYRHTAYSKPSVIYSTKLPSPPPLRHTQRPRSNNLTDHPPDFAPVIRPLLAAKPKPSNNTEISSNGFNRSSRQRISPIVLPPPPIVIVSHYPFDSMKPQRNRTRSRSPSLHEKNSSSLTSGPKPEDLMGDTDSARSMESLKARLKEAYDNFSKPTWIDESESWERVPLT